MTEKRSSYVYVKLTGAEKKAFYAMAGKQGISAYLRGLIAEYRAVKAKKKGSAGSVSSRGEQLADIFESSAFRGFCLEAGFDQQKQMWACQTIVLQTIGLLGKNDQDQRRKGPKEN